MKKDIFFYLSVFAVIAVLLIITRQYLLNFSEKFMFGQELGEVIFNISIGYLVTFWFYYLTVHRVQQQHKEKSYKLVVNRSNKIILYFNSLKQSVYEANSPIFQAIDIQMDSEYNYGQVLKFIKPASLTGNLNRAFQPMTWNERIVSTNVLIENALKDIFIVIPYLDADDIELFTDLYSSEYLEIVKSLDLQTIDDVGFLGTPMYEFDEIIRRIEVRFKNV